MKQKVKIIYPKSLQNKTENIVPPDFVGEIGEFIDWYDSPINGKQGIVFIPSHNRRFQLFPECLEFDQCDISTCSSVRKSTELEQREPNETTKLALQESISDLPRFSSFKDLLEDLKKDSEI